MPAPRLKPQTLEVLRYLESAGPLTSRDAWIFFSCSRLAARIRELRQAGYPIETDRSRGYATYRLTKAA